MLNFKSNEHESNEKDTNRKSILIRIAYARQFTVLTRTHLIVILCVKIHQNQSAENNFMSF